MLLHRSVNNLPVNERYRLEILHFYQPEFLPFIMPLTAPSIKVAEAAKVIENAQRDINIAFMNELSLHHIEVCCL